jgi:uncharacterized protein
MPSKPTSIFNYYGSPVTGENHFNRVIEKALLLKQAKEGKHTNLAAARRAGKTSLMRETLSTLKALGWVTVEIDLSHCKTFEDLYATFSKKLNEALADQQSVAVKVAQKIHEKLAAFGRRSLKVSAPGLGSAEVGAQTSALEEPMNLTQFTMDLTEVLEDIAKAAPANRLALGVDELTVFFHHYLKDVVDPIAHKKCVGELEQLLYAFRDLRQSSHGKWVWFHCSSIGLEGFAERYKMTHALTGLEAFELDAFSEKDARDMLQALWLGKEKTDEFPEAAATRLIERIGWLMPYFIQLLFHVLSDLRERGQDQSPPTAIQVDQAYDELVSVKYTREFKHWHDRLDELLSSSDLAMTHTLLDSACSHPKGIRSDKLFDAVAKKNAHKNLDELEKTMRHVLAMLERDGYLVRQLKEGKQTSSYVFRSPLLRDYWLQHCKRLASRRAPKGKST